VRCRLGTMSALHFHPYAPAAALSVTGEDAGDFLQSQFSMDLRPFEAGLCRYGLWLDVKGKVTADGFVLCEGPESFRIHSTHSPGGELRAKLERHIIADEVELEAAVRPAAVCLFGPGAGDALRELGLDVPEAGRYVRSAGGGAEVFPGRRSTGPGFEIFFDREEAAGAFYERLGKLPDAVRVSEERVQIERLRAGYPLVPVELGPGDLPGEGGLVPSAVSLTKGCFLGQEVVARMHNVGRAQRALFRVVGSGVPPACPAALTVEGKAAGSLRSAYPTDDGWLGAALLKLRTVEGAEAIEGDDFSIRIEERMMSEGRPA